MVFNVNKVEYFGDMWLFKDINGKPVFTIDDQTAKEINGELLLRLIMIVADGVNSAI